MRSRVVRVDPQVMAWLRDLARPGETPNAVIRRQLGLAPDPDARRSGFKR